MLEERPCEHCGARFVPVDRHMERRFCSQSCAWASQRRPATPKTCKGCGQSFITKGKRQFCCRRCALSHRRQRKQPTEERTCGGCGHIFRLPAWRARQGEGRFCSLQCLGSTRKKAVEKCCERCGLGFQPTARAVERGGGRFCSRECFQAARNQLVERACEQCGQTFRIRPSHAGDGRGRFCSRACYAAYRHQQKRCLGAQTYGYPVNRTQRGEIRKRDRYVCQRCGVGQNGKTHHVHHINGDKADNRPENLVTLCASCHSKATYAQNPLRLRPAYRPELA